MLYASRLFLSCRENKTAVFLTKTCCFKYLTKHLPPAYNKRKALSSSSYHRSSKLLMSTAVLCQDAVIPFIIWRSLSRETNDNADVCSLSVYSLVAGELKSKTSKNPFSPIKISLITESLVYVLLLSSTAVLHLVPRFIQNTYSKLKLIPVTDKLHNILHVGVILLKELKKLLYFCSSLTPFFIFNSDKQVFIRAQDDSPLH